jgi:hypothetical protein
VGLVLNINHGDSFQIGQTIITVTVKQRKNRRVTLHFDGPDKVGRIKSATNEPNGSTTKEK